MSCILVILQTHNYSFKNVCSVCENLSAESAFRIRETRTINVSLFFGEGSTTGQAEWIKFGRTQSLVKRRRRRVAMFSGRQNSFICFTDYRFIRCCWTSRTLTPFKSVDGFTDPSIDSMVGVAFLLKRFRRWKYLGTWPTQPSIPQGSVNE